ncbi:hypothetical protein C7N43_17170 [Sphingobacteriales bacterium UPWRP_1]|nr:hypothetical protein BVG80_13000 [Sphingobacteriales bacterium TSM_CSM]PSJ75802.1 hypothetical protein C7N43_17170 [Sphingobacteriales bacterium UPWRP_1]
MGQRLLTGSSFFIAKLTPPKTTYSQNSTTYSQIPTSYSFLLFCSGKFVIFTGNGNPKISVSIFKP